MVIISDYTVIYNDMLGTRVLKAKPYSPQSKGGVEVFNRFVNAFLAETSAQKIRTLEELNRFWDIWLEEYYHNKPHEGIEEYYKSLRSPVPAGGISISINQMLDETASMHKVTTFFGDLDKPEKVVSFTNGSELTQAIESVYHLKEKYS